MNCEHCGRVVDRVSCASLAAKIERNTDAAVTCRDVVVAGWNPELLFNYWSRVNQRAMLLCASCRRNQFVLDTLACT